MTEKNVKSTFFAHIGKLPVGSHNNLMQVSFVKRFMEMGSARKNTFTVI